MYFFHAVSLSLCGTCLAKVGTAIYGNTTMSELSIYMYMYMCLCSTHYCRYLQVYLQVLDYAV